MFPSLHTSLVNDLLLAESSYLIGAQIEKREQHLGETIANNNMLLKLRY